MKTMLIRNIPDPIHKRIKNMAAKSEMTLNAYMIQLMKEKSPTNGRAGRSSLLLFR